jgi:hypothetical protein
MTNAGFGFLVVDSDVDMDDNSYDNSYDNSDDDSIVQLQLFLSERWTPGDLLAATGVVVDKDVDFDAAPGGEPKRLGVPQQIQRKVRSHIFL